MNPQTSTQWICSETQNGIRLDKFLGSQSDLPSRAKIQSWIADNIFSVNGKDCKKNGILKTGDVVVLEKQPPTRPEVLIPQDIPFETVYQDDSLAVVNKPTGLVVHPGSGIYEGTLANGLRHHFLSLSDRNGPMRPGIIHRLDKDTSGLMVIAKSNEAHDFLAEQLKNHTMNRTYYGLAWRQIHQKSGTIEKSLARQKNFRIRRSISPEGQPAITHYEVKEYFKFCTYVKLMLETGRTHQIRVHLSSIGNPIVGDPLYGGNPFNMQELEPKYHPQANRLLKILKTQALHAREISFIHPDTKKSMSFEVPLPGVMEEALEFLRKDSKVS